MIDGLSLINRVAEGLRKRKPQRYFMMETYGPDGEIEEASECHPIDDELPDGAVAAVIISGVGYAKPRTDWRKRGIVPPRGYHRSQWRE
jgi:hypothetical protein